MLDFHWKFSDFYSFLLKVNPLLDQRGRLLITGFFTSFHKEKLEVHSDLDSSIILPIEDVKKNLVDFFGSNFTIVSLNKLLNDKISYSSASVEIFQKFRSGKIDYFLIIVDKPVSKNPIEILMDKYEKGEIGQYDYIREKNRINRNLFYLSKSIKNTDIKKIEILDDDLIFTTRRDEIKLHFNGCDRRGVPFDILNFKSYESESEEIMLKLLKNSSVIFDIGAHIGWYSILLAKKNENSKVYSFEPIPYTFDFLRRNIEENNLTNVKIFNYGLSNENQQVDFYFFPQGSVLASQKNLIDCRKSKKIKCNVKMLDSFATEEQLNSLDFLKCDVEGSELAVLQGGEKTIAKFSPIILIELFHRWCYKFHYHPNDVLFLLKNLGYECFFPVKDKLIKIDNFNEEPKQERLNYLFLHKKNHQKEIEQIFKEQKFDE